MLKHMFLVLFLYEISSCMGTYTVREFKDWLIQDGIDIYKQLPVAIRDLKNLPVTVDNIKLVLYTKKKRKVPTIVDIKNPHVFTPKSPVVFIIHGWMSDITGQWCKELKNVFLKKYKIVSVVLVDWSVYARQGYFVSTRDVQDIGDILGEFLVNLNALYSIPLANILLVGHSLGAHICGFMGKKVTELTGQKLARIVGLDAAGPEFQDKPEGKRLSRTDARVVQLIHTSAANFGFTGSCGTIDFFPNGGVFQPGCLTSFPPIACSHFRSTQYFIAALRRPKKFLARKCGNWSAYLNTPESCEDEYVSMGDLQTKSAGNFYLKTTNGSPYYHRIL